MCLSKIISDFEINCPYGCGIRVKKGDLAMHQEKYCPEKLFECAECGKKMKKDIFKYHIAREHQDTMLNKFLKQENNPNEPLLPQQNGENGEGTLTVRRSIPPGWSRWYMDPPIQWVGVPAQHLQDPVDEQDEEESPNSQHLVQINFHQLRNMDKFHYVMGMFQYITKYAVYYTFKLGVYTCKEFYRATRYFLNMLF